MLTVQFLRGGKTNFGSRDEILNDASIRPATIGTIGPATGEEQRYSYFYQDDAPAPGDPPQVRTDDDGSPPAGYAHKMGDIFHSELLLLEPPRYFQYLSANVQPRTSSSTTGEAYLDFANRQAKRRKVLFAGANDGFLHAFDGGVWNRDTVNFNQTFDLGTGREIFAYSPTSLLADKFTNLLNFPPLPQYFVDGSVASADVWVDPEFTGTPDETERAWRTVLVGGLRQGGHGYYALDVTQPDDIDTNTASATFGEMTGNKDASPGCLDGAGTSCVAGAACQPRVPVGHVGLRRRSARPARMRAGPSARPSARPGRARSSGGSRSSTRPVRPRTPAGSTIATSRSSAAASIPASPRATTWPPSSAPAPWSRAAPSTSWTSRRARSSTRCREA